MAKHTLTIHRQQQTNRLSVFDDSVGLQLKGSGFLLSFVQAVSVNFNNGVYQNVNYVSA